MQTNLRQLLLLLLALAICLTTWMVRRAMADRVTLDVREAPIEAVVRSVERQTSEIILLQPGVTGRVTISVNRLPLSEALRLVAAQTDSRSTEVHALHRKRGGHRPLQRALSQGDRTGPGWTNASLVLRPSPAELFATRASAERASVSLHLTNVPASDVARRLGRLAGVRVVVEDAAIRPISLQIDMASPGDAVAAFARALGLRRSRFYVLSPLFHGPRLAPPDGDRFVAQPPLDAPLVAPGQAGPVMIPLGELPPDGLALPPPTETPEADLARLKAALKQSLRDSTPEQRAARLRDGLREVPPAPSE